MFGVDVACRPATVCAWLDAISDPTRSSHSSQTIAIAGSDMSFLLDLFYSLPWDAVELTLISNSTSGRANAC